MTEIGNPNKLHKHKYIVGNVKANHKALSLFRFPSFSLSNLINSDI